MQPDAMRIRQGSRLGVGLSAVGPSSPPLVTHQSVNATIEGSHPEQLDAEYVRVQASLEITGVPLPRAGALRSNP
jgi:hypothetical protein